MPMLLVRHGAMGKREVFTLTDGDAPVGSDVIVRTPRGVEWGEVTEIRPASAAAKSKPAGEVLRRATQADYERQREITEQREVEEFRYCSELIERHELPMKLRAVEHLFGGHKIIFYFLSEGRVDFRGLVRDLAGRYRMRIEMRQIGVRDEARMLGLVGPCGDELCCRRFLGVLKPVPMKLAKDQKSTLDPAKISGRCGRLKCCLKFEEELYEELRRNLPRRGTRVRTAGGEGAVVDYEVLGQTVTVELPDRTRQRFPVAEVEVLE
jgi:cell fate regulator YaaT (PSP1 superfamily)